MSLDATDRLDLQDLLLRYVAAARLKDNEPALREVFTEDAVLDGPRGYYEGPSGLTAFAEQERGSQSSVFDASSSTIGHTIIANVLADGDGDVATIDAKLFKIRFRIETGSVDIAASGSYHCDARRVSGKWRIARRLCQIDGLPQFRETADYAAGRRWVRTDSGWLLAEADESAVGE